MTSIIEVQNLVKRYKKADRNAVDGISFSVVPGAFFVLLGPNGAGKTTTISILTTTLVPTTGTVHIAGHDIVRNSSNVRQNIGIIFQKPSLDLNLTAEENIRFHVVLYGIYPFRPTYSMMPRAYRQKVDELAQVLGVQNEIFRPIRVLSGGMRRKLEIVRSLMHSPSVLFLDEPSVGLDPTSRRDLWSYLKQVRAESGTTVFLTTHYLDEAEDADAVCIINRGRIVAQGTPADVKAALTEEYLLIDSEQHDLLTTELRANAIEFEDGSPIRVRLNGRTIHQVFRTIETPLHVVRTHAPTLEDAYLEIVGRETESTT